MNHYSFFSACTESQAGGAHGMRADWQTFTGFITRRCDRLPGGSERSSHLSSSLQGYNVAGRSREKLRLYLTLQLMRKDVSVCPQEKTAVVLLRKQRAYRDNQALQSALRETLALIGYMDPVKGHGIRVLSIDGGGTR